jgi:HJR/Mrr/RecB family endonuclease
MIKLIICCITLVILFKLLSIAFYNLTYDIKRVLKKKEFEFDQQALKRQEELIQKKIQKQNELRQQEIKRQEELIRLEIQRQEELRQLEIKKQEELRQQEIFKQKMQISYIDELSNGYNFEEYIADLLKKLGYTNVEIAPSYGDDGSDILATENGVTYAIQCKWCSLENNVGNEAVREIFSRKESQHKDFRSNYNKSLFYAISKRKRRKT